MEKWKMAVVLRIEEDRYVIKKRYLDYLKKYDILPILIAEENENLLPLCDGVLFVGGIDVNPSLYGQENLHSVFDDDLDRFEYHMLNLALSLRLPIFGICRGIQLLNVYFGGTLHQNIPHHQNERHYVTNTKTDWFPFQGAEVNSFHHQAIDRLAENFQPFLCSKDGTIEGIYDEMKKIIAVQYHPELDDPFHILCFFKSLMLLRKA